jgi:hypothetical protein
MAGGRTKMAASVKVAEGTQKWREEPTMADGMK